MHRNELPAGRSASPKRLARRRRRGRRAWSAALLWKDFHYVGDGKRGFAVRAIIYAAVVTIIYVLNHWQRPFDPDNLGGTMMWTAVVGLLLESTLLAAHVFRDEITSRTLAGIFILPISVARIAYAKIAGCLLSLIPVIVLFCAGAAVAPRPLIRFIDDTIDEPGAWLALTVAVFFVHLVVFLSLYLKRSAVAAAVGILLVGYVVFVSVAMLLLTSITAVSGGRNSMDVMNIMITCIAAVVVGLTVLLHLLSGVTLRQLAGQ